MFAKKQEEPKKVEPAKPTPGKIDANNVFPPKKQPEPLKPVAKVTPPAAKNNAANAGG